MESNTMITAEQARELAGPTVEEYLKDISVYIEKAAKEQKREVIIRTQPYADWMYSESSAPEVAKQVLAELRKAGFTVEMYYDALQFVDLGMRIKW
jgi:hypothetical protein